MMPTLIESSLRAIALFVTTAILLKALGIRHPAIAYRTWATAMLAMLLAPVFVMWTPRFFTLGVPVQASITPQIDLSMFALDEAPVWPPHASRPQPTTASSQKTSGRQWLSLIWLSGVALFGSRLLWGTWLTRRFGRSARPGIPGALLHPHCASPLTIGWWHPVVILPITAFDWPKDKLEAVLLHEGAHARRRDPLFFWLADLNCCLYWFHPASWWVSRRLHMLAEDACDAEVLDSGQEPARYARWLLELAADVSTAGSRVRLWGATATGGISRRIQRIVSGRARAPMQGGVRITMARVCTAALLVSGAACRIETVEKALPGQPSMNDLLHRHASVNQENTRKWRGQEAAIRSMSPEQAAKLVAELKQHPDNVDQFRTAIRYYQVRSDVAGLTKLTLWYIEHHPNGTVSPWVLHPAWDRAAWERGAALWRRNLARPDATQETWKRAAFYIQGGSKEEAEGILLRGQAKFPTENWATPLGQLYALTLIGAVGPIADGNTVRETDPKQANTPFAQRVLRDLHTSRDPALLVQTAHWVVSWSRRHYPSSIPPHAASLITRAEQVAPADRRVRTIKVFFDEAQERYRVRGIPADRMTDTDRLAALTLKLSSYGLGSSTLEIDGQQLLSLASRDRDHPKYGDALFAANSALAHAALKRGDRKLAVRYLLASAAGPVTDRMRYGPIFMTTARQLVDSGERAAVATFLERCSKFNDRGAEQARWAAELRRGLNPDLLPYSSY
ncbi:MAG TPA: M56 family metallopeptidase [Bryobacteraceae bacterium]|nr:M56 family metallopeptidase [Bryobacteraceae bacterium]